MLARKLQTLRAAEGGREREVPVPLAVQQALLTDMLDGDGGAVDRGDVGGERPNDQRVSEAGPGTETAAAKGAVFGGVSLCVAR
jgi:hypothetical protein